MGVAGGVGEESGLGGGGVREWVVFGMGRAGMRVWTGRGRARGGRVTGAMGVTGVLPQLGTARSWSEGRQRRRARGIGRAGGSLVQQATSCATE